MDIVSRRGAHSISARCTYHLGEVHIASRRGAHSISARFDLRRRALLDRLAFRARPLRRRRRSRRVARLARRGCRCLSLSPCIATFQIWQAPPATFLIWQLSLLSPCASPPSPVWPPLHLSPTLSPVMTSPVASGSSERIVAWGHSLGTGVASHLAHALQRRGTPLQALVLEAPFTSLAAMTLSYPTGYDEMDIVSRRGGHSISARWT